MYVDWHVVCQRGVVCEDLCVPPTVSTQELSFTRITLSLEGAYRLEAVLTACHHCMLDRTESYVFRAHPRTHASNRYGALTAQSFSFMERQTIVDYPFHIIEDSTGGGLASGHGCTIYC